MTNKQIRLLAFRLLLLLSVNFGLPFRTWKISGGLIDYELPY